MPVALIALAVASIAAMVLGPLGVGWIEWRISVNALNQTYGADAAQGLLVAPLALVAAWLWYRRQRLAAPLALGVGLATLYYAVASVMGPDYARYAGNNERYFLLFLGLVVLSWVVAAMGWSALDAHPPAPSRLMARGFGALLVAGGAVISLAWLAQLVEIAMTGGMAAPGDALAYAEAPSAFWLIRVVDLGFLVPVCFATGVGLWRGSATAIKASYGVACFMTLQAIAVLAMGFIMLWRQDPTATPGLVYALTPLSLAMGALTVRLLASYARGKVGPDVRLAIFDVRRVGPEGRLGRRVEVGGQA